jgi:arylsulfatase A-like enzyme
MKITRREFAARASASALLGGAVALPRLSGKPQSRPNILLLITDQQYVPPLYGPNEGADQGLKEILGFRPLSSGNAYQSLFPAFMRLRRNSVVFSNHYTASSACVPSRACLMTGSYRTGVEQTDGLFKDHTDVCWLDPEGVPTLGDWFLAAGYTTHYYGKWHVSHPGGDDRSLKRWGFSDWESSYPDPHVGTIYNTAGIYRDGAFADNLADFLDSKSRDHSGTPWLAVGSLVNPHDVCVYPWSLPGSGVQPYPGWPPPPGIPRWGEQSLPNPYNGNVTEPLNPDGFPQQTYSLPHTFWEPLYDKPRCQKDYSLKFGIAARSTFEVKGFSKSALPYQMSSDPLGWQLAYNQFYMYCQYLADLQLRKILDALDSSSLTENTIVVFLSDHGEMAGAHGGMIQKWHNAYEETIRVPMVVSSPLVNKRDDRIRVVSQPTSSIDLVPTLLGLAGLDQRALLAEMQSKHGTSIVEPFVGADLSPHARGEREGDIIGPDGKPRAGVLFLTNDAITEAGASQASTHNPPYPQYLIDVDDAIAKGYPLAPGPVRQPNHIRALCTGDWKLVRYMDPNGVERDEWELYCLKADVRETVNLVDFRTGEVRRDVAVPGVNRGEIVSNLQKLKRELARQEAACLNAPVEAA